MVNFFSPKGLERYRKHVAGLEETITHYEKQVGEATSQGAESWHDNAPYEALRDNIKISDKRAVDARKLFTNAQIREYPRELKEPIADYGVGVRINRDGKPADFKIVGHGDTDIDKGRILYESPLAKTLIGRREGETFKAEINGRVSEIRIEQVYIISDPDLV